MLNLARLFNSIHQGFPCLPNGEWKEGDPDYFDETDEEHLKAFYDRVMACVNASHGCWNRVIFGFQTVVDNDVFDPNAHTLQWHPTLVDAVNQRNANKAKPESDTEISGHSA